MHDKTELDYFNILDLVHFDVLVTLLDGKILTENVLFVSPFQEYHL